PWLIYAGATFGSPIPNTLGAKIAQRESGYWGSSLIFFRGGMNLWKRAAGPAALSRALLGITGLLALVGVIVSARRKKGWQLLAPLFVSAAALAIADGLLPDVPPYPWYYAPIFFVGLIFAGV